MATEQSFADYVVDQIREAGEVRARKMFGEYALYCSGKVVALLCDNRLYVKPTAAGKEYLGTVREEPPYKGAKPYFLIGGELENREWLCELIIKTADELPEPKPKIKKPKTAKG